MKDETAWRASAVKKETLLGGQAGVWLEGFDNIVMCGYSWEVLVWLYHYNTVICNYYNVANG